MLLSQQPWRSEGSGSAGSDHLALFKSVRVGGSRPGTVLSEGNPSIKAAGLARRWTDRSINHKHTLGLL